MYRPTAIAHAAADGALYVLDTDPADAYERGRIVRLAWNRGVVVRSRERADRPAYRARRDPAANHSRHFSSLSLPLSPSPPP
eukprot:SAG11_NODE_13448_length_654_cov_27.753153_1_plen_82_part_00